MLQTPSQRAPGTPATVIVDTSRSAHARLQPLGLNAVRLADRFWVPRRRINRAVTLPAQYHHCERSGRLDNFRRAAGALDAPFQGLFFNDSDVYKWLEATAWTLATEQDPALQQQVDMVIDLVTAAQDADGYLNTYFTGERVAERWTNLKVMHELYCAGHLLQAAVAHHRATRSRRLLDVAVRLADHIGRAFGPTTRAGACGHPEIEMALVELARETGDARYLRQAAFFLDQRGRQPPLIGGEEYGQDHAPVRAQHEVVGHAVRALYLYCGMADVYAETGEKALWTALDALWHDLQERKAYVTGGAGARHEGEAFGAAYELPNERAYAETCAAIATVMWNWRLLLVTGEARFADALELALCNGALAGLSLDGETYFYVNPLADRGDHRRQPWFGCACCPPNLARLLASLPGYCYTTSPEGLWVHLYAAGAVRASLAGAGEVAVSVRTDYPWDGEITLEAQPAAPTTFSLFLRIPAWAEGATLAVNDEPWTSAVEPGSYAVVHRRWEAGDTARLVLPLPVRTLRSHPHVTNNHGRVALMRGPLVYCIEGVDHPDADVWDVTLPPGATWEVSWEPELLGGIMVARTEGRVLADAPPPHLLYRLYNANQARYRSVPLTAIPYYAWADRKPGPMAVWMPVGG